MTLPPPLLVTLQPTKVTLEHNIIKIYLPDGLLMVYLTDAGWRIRYNDLAIKLDENYLPNLIGLGLK